MSDNVLVLCHGSLLYLNTEVNLVALDLNEASFYVELLLTVLSVYSTRPFVKVEMIGAWSLRISKEPTIPGTNTLSTSP